MVLHPLRCVCWDGGGGCSKLQGVAGGQCRPRACSAAHCGGNVRAQCLRRGADASVHSRRATAALWWCRHRAAVATVHLGGVPCLLLVARGTTMPAGAAARACRWRECCAQLRTARWHALHSVEHHAQTRAPTRMNACRFKASYPPPHPFTYSQPRVTSRLLLGRTSGEMNSAVGATRILTAIDARVDCDR